MKTFIKHALKILFAYSTAAAVFAFFVIAPLSMANNMTLWLLAYSFVMFMFMFFIVSKTALSIGKSEKYDDSNPSAIKGFLYGLAAMIPYLILGLVHLLIFDNSLEIGLRIFHYIFRCALGPMYFIINTLNYTWYAFLTAYAVVPVISGLWYFLGLKGIDKIHITKKLKEDEDFLK
ncbi:MAG: hypothetical protein GXY21_10025 [Clostridiaceae bacterium]|jgi:hypothetical protein|nr:hypothetical protein [Clostridia bacterium]NLV34854.1 hypothetical protein [Clostridiaceae bacterium]HPB16773.1 hypothetical protein [Clostridia bacterium]